MAYGRTDKRYLIGQRREVEREVFRRAVTYLCSQMIKRNNCCKR